MTEALDSIIETDIVEKIIEDLSSLGKHLNRERLAKMINYIKTPTPEETKEIMRGIVSL